MLVKVVLNLDGFRELRTCAAMQQILEQEADSLAARAGDLYEAREFETTGGRVRGRVAVTTKAGSARAMAHEAKHHTLAGLV